MEDNVDDPFGLLPLPDWANAEHWELINLPENIKGLPKYILGIWAY